MSSNTDSVSQQTVESLINKHSLPILIAAVMQHADMPEKIRIGFYNDYFSEALDYDSDAPEHYAYVLNLPLKKDERKSKLAPERTILRKQHLEPAFVLDNYAGGPGIRPLLDEILLQDDAVFAPTLVQIFEILKEQTELDRLDLLERAQDYAFTRTIEFERASDAFKRKTRNERPQEASEPTEPSETTNAVSAQAWFD